MFSSQAFSLILSLLLPFPVCMCVYVCVCVTVLCLNTNPYQSKDCFFGFTIYAVNTNGLSSMALFQTYGYIKVMEEECESRCNSALQVTAWNSSGLKVSLTSLIFTYLLGFVHFHKSGSPLSSSMHCSENSI